MRSRLLPVAALAAAALIAALVSGHASDEWSRPHAKPKAVGTLGPGFLGSAASPAPESTVTPRPGSWDGVHASKDYRVVLLTAGTDPTTRTLVRAVTEWAEQQHASLRTVTATRPDQFIPRIGSAIDLAPDLIISVGDGLIDPLAQVTPSHLDRQFLIIGAEVAEPTANVTAADWTGAGFRGEGIGMPANYDPATFTPERAGRAIRAGVAAVLNGLTGIVIWLG